MTRGFLLFVLSLFIYQSTGELKNVKPCDASRYDARVSHSWRYGPPVGLKRQFYGTRKKTQNRVIDFETTYFSASFDFERLRLSSRELNVSKTVGYRECTCSPPRDEIRDDNATNYVDYPIRLVRSGRYSTHFWFFTFCCEKVVAFDLKVWPDCITVSSGNGPSDTFHACIHSNNSELKVFASNVGTGHGASVASHRSLEINVEAPLPSEGGRHACFARPEFSTYNITIVNEASCSSVARLVLIRRNGGLGIVSVVPLVLHSQSGKFVQSGIFTQTSKNWHTNPQVLYAETALIEVLTYWEMPPESRLNFQIQLLYGNFGNLPAVSHAQLSLIGWGRSGGLWEQVAHGCDGGESITFEPDGNHRDALVNDIRPVYTCSISSNDGGACLSGWTENIGGANILVIYLGAGFRRRIEEVKIRSVQRHTGPVMTNVSYIGKIYNPDAMLMRTISTTQTGDFARHFFSFAVSAKKKSQKRRWERYTISLFEMGTRMYNEMEISTVYYGDNNGLLGTINLRDIMKQRLRISFPKGTVLPVWFALDGDSLFHHSKTQVRSFRGLILRSTNIELKALRFLLRRSVHTNGWMLIAAMQNALSFPVQGFFEMVVAPKRSEYYRGSDTDFVLFLKNEPLWRIIHEEAISNDFRVQRLSSGHHLERMYPIRIRIGSESIVSFKVISKAHGSNGLVPVTLSKSRHACEIIRLRIDGEPVKIAFQTNRDDGDGSFECTTLVDLRKRKKHLLEFHIL